MPDTAWYTETLRDQILRYSLNNDPDNVPAPLCTQQGPVTVGGKTTLYPQVAPSPAPPPLKLGG